MENQNELAGVRVAFLTLGCKVNAYETKGMQELFQKAGATITDFSEEAEVYVINTCSVTNIADRKSRQMLHKAKKRGGNALIVATGCYVQAAGEKLTDEDGVDLIIGNNRKSEIVSLTKTELQKRQKSQPIFAVSDIAKEKEYEELPISTVTEHTRAYIKIEDGCNQFCSYCIIPYVRGRVRSRNEEEILSEITRLSAEGYREFVLTGIHISSYGLFQKNETASIFDETLSGTERGKKVLPLLALLKKINGMDGVERIRLGSLEPRIMTEEFVSELSELDKLCPHFHLSLQSGCDATLRRMNRKYTTEEYLTSVKLLRRHFVSPAITTDIIVGFPGETEEEFQTTLSFAEQVGFSQIHIFKYSRRNGTAADRMDGQLTEAVKTERSDRLFALLPILSERFLDRVAELSDPVLFEEKTEYGGREWFTGHTTRYLRVAVPAGEIDLKGKSFPVRLTKEVTPDFVVASLVEGSF